jgi:hypothetical protein
MKLCIYKLHCKYIQSLLYCQKNKVKKISKKIVESFQIPARENRPKELVVFKLLRTTKLENQIYVLGKNLIPGRVLVSSLFKKKGKNQDDPHTWP